VPPDGALTPTLPAAPVDVSTGAPSVARVVADPARLAAVRATGVLDTLPEPAFDRIVALAARTLGAPIALLTLVDAGRDFVKAQVGLPEPLATAREIAATPTFCQDAVVRHEAGRTATGEPLGPGVGEPVVVGDAFADPYYCVFPAVQGFGARACVTAPLLGAQGRALGALCVIDYVARAWTPAEVAALGEIAQTAAAELALRAAYEAHARERARLRTLYDALAFGVVVHDATGAIAHANPEAERLLALTLAQLQGRTPMDPGWRAVREDGRPFAGDQHPAMVALRAERPVRGVVMGVYAAGEDPRARWLLVDAVPLADAAGAVAEVVVSFVDITDQVRARREAEAARAEAERANATKSQFLATMSHELRTPLNAIAGYVELVALGIHGPVTEAQMGALSRVQRAQRHLLGVINDVLNFARLDAGRVEYDVRPTDLSELVADVAPMIEPQLAAKQLAYDVRPPAEGANGRSLHVLADAEKLRQVLLNLLSNAVKFTPAGGRVTVEVLERLVGAGPGGPDAGTPDVVYLRVSDTGVGIAPDQLEAVFEPFVQVGKGYAREAEGIGLGLAISRDLARGMGGELRARSAPGEGSAFTVALRRAPAPSEGPGVPADVPVHDMAEVTPGVGPVTGAEVPG